MLMKKKVLEALLNRIDVGDLTTEEELTLEELKMMCTHEFSDEVRKDGTVSLFDINRYRYADLWGTNDVGNLLEDYYPEVVNNISYVQYSLMVDGITEEVDWEDEAFSNAQRKAEVVKEGMDRWLISHGYIKDISNQQEKS